jgi:hypothetical protein
MDFSSHEMRRAILMAIPTLIMLGLGLFGWWLKKQNAEISATLQRRDK